MIPLTVKFTEAESRSLVARAVQGRGMRNCYSIGITFQVYKVLSYSVLLYHIESVINTTVL